MKSQDSEEKWKIHTLRESTNPPQKQGPAHKEETILGTDLSLGNAVASDQHWDPHPSLLSHVLGEKRVQHEQTSYRMPFQDTERDDASLMRDPLKKEMS
jgi:hypothetical protein